MIEQSLTTGMINRWKLRFTKKLAFDWLIPVLGAAFIILISRWGIGTSPDSISYIRIARILLTRFLGENVVSTASLAVPGQHAPLFSLSLSALGLFGFDPLVGARWLNAVLFGANILVVGVAIRRIMPGSTWLATAGSLIALVALPVLNVHSMAWSEPLFIFLMLLSFICLASYLDQQKRKFLLLSAGFASLALLTRYAGAAVLLCSLIALLALQTGSVIKRVIDALIFGVIGVIPAGLWVLLNLSETGTATNRVFAYHPIGFSHFWQGVHTVASWFLIPANLPGWVRLLLIGFFFALLLVLSIGTLRKTFGQSSGQKPALPGVLILFILSYTVFLILSISFFDANTPLDNRILIPVYFSILIITLSFAGSIFRMVGPVARLGMIALWGIFFVSSTFQAVAWGNRYYREGSGFTSRSWQESQVLELVRKLDVGLSIYSNSPEAVYLHTGREALSLPRKFNSMQNTSNPGLQAELDAMKATIDAGKAALVFFDYVERPTLISEDELLEELPLQVSFRVEDGTIYVSSIER